MVGLKPDSSNKYDWERYAEIVCGIWRSRYSVRSIHGGNTICTCISLKQARRIARLLNADGRTE